MRKTVVGLVDSFDDVRDLVDELIDDGFSRESIGIIAKKQDEGAQARRERLSDEEIRGVKVGLEAGAAVGGVAGLLIGAGVFTVTGLGAIVAAGPLAAALAGVGLGALTGGVYGAIRNLGISEEEAEYYSEGIRRGGVLVSVETDEKGAGRAADIMESHGAVDINERAKEWKRSGWKAQDETREGPSH